MAKNEWMKERKKERKNEWMNEWKKGRKKERKLSSAKASVIFVQNSGTELPVNDNVSCS